MAKKPDSVDDVPEAVLKFKMLGRSELNDDVMDTFREAFEKYEERDRMYGAAWLEMGWRGNVAQVIRKAARVKKQLWRNGPMSDSALDDLEDLFVYVGMTLTLIRRESEWGPE
jgi:hypothetical protein